MNWTRVRRTSGWLLLAASLIALAWNLWPLPYQARSLAIAPEEMRPKEMSAEASTTLEQRLLSLEWPALIRAGEPGTVRLVLDPSTRGEKPLPASSLEPGEYSVLAEARLELPGIPHAPQGQVSQALLPGRPLTFIWDLVPVVAGEAQGTIWLHLRFIPVDSGPELRQVLTAQRLEIHVVNFLGLSGPWARALGSAGVAVGAALCLDGVFLWLWRRLESYKGAS